MSLTSGVHAALTRYGSPVTVAHGDIVRSVHAFIQPLRRRHRLYINDRFSPAGYFDNAYRLYLGEGNVPVYEKDIITQGDERYTVVSCDSFCVGGEVVYIWAVLSPVKEIEEVYADEQLD